MAEFEMNEPGTPNSEPNAIDNGGDSRRGALKRVALAAAALATTNFVTSKASAQAGRAAGQEDGESLERKLITEAAKNPKFLEQLRANPTQAVSKFLGIELPAGTKIKLIEENATDYTLVLPYIKPAGPGNSTKPDNDQGLARGPFHSRIFCCHYSLTCTHKGGNGN